MPTVAEQLLIQIREEGGAEVAVAMSRVTGETKALEKQTKTAHEHTRKLGGAFGSLKTLALSAAGMAGIGAVGVGLGDAIHNAQEFQDAQAQLRASLHANVRRPSAEAANQMGEFADTLSMAGGFAAPQAIQGMTQLMRTTHNVNRTMRDTTLATNIARGAHVDLSRAIRAVQMTEGGRLSMLTRLGIVLPKHISAQRAMVILQDRYSGSLRAFNSTAAGSINNFRNTVDVLAEKLGTLLMPILTKVVGALSKFVSGMMTGHGAGGRLARMAEDLAHALEQVWTFVKHNATAFEMLGGAIAAVVLAVKAWSVATRIATRVQEVFDAVMAANPVVLVTLAIVALIGALVVAYVKVRWFHNAVNAAWRFLRTAAVNTVHFIIRHWQLFAAYFLTVPFLVYKVVRLVLDHWGDIVKFFRGLPGVIGHALASLGKAMAQPFIAAYNWIHRQILNIRKDAQWLVDQIVHFFSNLPGRIMGAIGSLGSTVGGKLGGVLKHIPGVGAVTHLFHQHGGPVHEPFSIVGERGPELVRLPAGSFVYPTGVIPADARAGGAGGGGGTIVLYNVLDGRVLSKSVVRQGLLQQSKM